jgi:hypothetical protein
MTNAYLKHPDDEALERFLLRHSDDQELEILETHILACDTCITRLEALELQIADMKAALSASEEKRIQNELDTARAPRKNWFGLPTLSWAGAAACGVLALGLTVIPHVLRKSQPASNGSSPVTDFALCSGSDRDVNLATCRGSESATLPGNHPLNLRVATTDIPQGPVDVQVVNGSGDEVWQGQTTVKEERAEVRLPPLSASGPYFLRFYARSAGTERELLREFRFEVK